MLYEIGEQACVRQMPDRGLRSNWSAVQTAVQISTALRRLLWVIALAGMCALNASSNGGIAHGFLTLPFWEPLSKLTFGAYLIHPMLLCMYYFEQSSPFYFGDGSHFNQTMVFSAAVSLSYGMAMVTYVLVELPCDSLIKRMLGQDRKR